MICVAFIPKKVRYVNNKTGSYSYITHAKKEDIEVETQIDLPEQNTVSDKLFIQITNSCEGNVEFADDMPVSTMENHGLGTKSIAAIAQKYGGVYSFTAEYGVFTTSIIL